MKNLTKTDFDILYEELNELNEIYINDFVTSGEDNYYHFYTDLYDLLNSLMNGRIYSNKNKGRPTQQDKHALEGESFVCMTSEYEGKKWMAKRYKRPFGIAINKDVLKNLCNSKGYRFNPDIMYNQFGEKATGRAGRANGVAFDDPSFSDFEIFAVGKLSDGTFFISGGQGPRYDNLWPAQRFYDEGLYKTLSDWFTKNMYSGKHSEHYYHFINNTIGEPSELDNYGNAINSTGNINKKYKPRKDTKLDKNGKVSYGSSISFDIEPKVAFDEIIGIGPVKLYDEEYNNILLSIPFVKANSTRGYSGPKLFGFNKTLNGFPAEPKLIKGYKTKKFGNQWNLQTDEATFKALCNIYNEHENRIYIPNGKNFSFSLSDIDTIILPTEYISGEEYINMLLLAKTLEEGVTFDLNVSDAELAKTLIYDGILISPVEKLSIDTGKLIRGLLKLLQASLKDVNMELVPDMSVKNSNKKPVYTKHDNEIVDMPAKVNKSDHTRYIINGEPDYPKARGIKWKGIPSVLAPVEIRPGETAEARIGAETIVTAFDENGNKYALFVDNAHKTDNFLELPGGGLYDLPHGLSDLENIAKQRLQYKCGINVSADITNFKDTGKALLLSENGIALDKTVQWDWSYYRLYTARYTKVIDSNDLEYTNDNRAQATEMGIEGYVSDLRWVPVDSIDFDRAVKSRYANIYNLIKNN